LEKPFGVLKGEIEEKETRVKEEMRVKDVDPTTWVSPPPTGGGTCSGPTPDMDDNNTITTETNQVISLFTCLRG
jgi:hypothetical protein